MEFLIPQFKDIIDILVIAFLIYQSLLIIRKSGGYQCTLGIALFACFVFSGQYI